MRKTRLIIIVTIIALLAVGGAYAAWTSRVTISANAGAGEMDVEISSVTVGRVSEYVTFGTDSISVSEDKKAATVSIQNLYPGAEANLTIVVTNIGTIPVMLSNAAQLREQAVNTETNDTLSASIVNMLVVKYTATAVTKNGQVRASDSSSETTMTLFQNTGMIIEAGKTIEFDMCITLDKEASDETENALFRFQFIPMFVQSNMEIPSGGSVNEASSVGAPATMAPVTEEPNNQNDTVSEARNSSSMEGLSMQTNGMLGAWNGSEEYSGVSKDVEIPSAIDDINIIRIGQNTFRDKGLVSVTFQEGSQIERIHARAFQNNNLTEIVLPDSLIRIDTRAFYDNPISSVIIPNGVITIENNAFNKLTMITVGNGLTDLKDGAINGNNAFRDAYSAANGGSGSYVWDGKSWIKS
jgi:predicted ribosomally synthesized peptide with SipW-like signal peptide